MTFSDIARMRLSTISFFAVLFLLCSLAVRWIWNSLRKDFPRLPYLSFRRAVSLIALWGLLFLLVLTMISGARELLTPGAWKKDGLTYKLKDELEPAQAEASRRLPERARRLTVFEPRFGLTPGATTVVFRPTIRNRKSPTTLGACPTRPECGIATPAGSWPIKATRRSRMSRASSPTPGSSCFRAGRLCR